MVNVMIESMNDFVWSATRRVSKARSVWIGLVSLYGTVIWRRVEDHGYGRSYLERTETPGEGRMRARRRRRRLTRRRR